jgi:hypothetical protein
MLRLVQHIWREKLRGPTGKMPNRLRPLPWLNRLFHYQKSTNYRTNGISNKDDQAIGILSTFLEDSVARDLRNFTKEQYEEDECGYAKGAFTSFQLMSRIKARYAKPTPLVYYKDFVELMKWRLHERDDPLVKIAQLSKLFKRLQDFGLTFDNKFQALFLLHSTPASWGENFITIQLANFKDDSASTFEKISEHVVMFYTNKGFSKSKSSALSGCMSHGNKNYSGSPPSWKSQTPGAGPSQPKKGSLPKFQKKQQNQQSSNDGNIRATPQPVH